MKDSCTHRQSSSSPHTHTVKLHIQSKLELPWTKGQQSESGTCSSVREDKGLELRASGFGLRVADGDRDTSPSVIDSCGCARDLMESEATLH